MVLLYHLGIEAYLFQEYPICYQRTIGERYIFNDQAGDNRPS